jgi:phage gp29-like protein
MDLNPGLKTEIATISQDITQPIFGGVMRHQDDTLLTRGGGQGLKIYDQIERDPHAFAVLQKRKMAVISREWDVKPASTRSLDKKAADLVKAQLSSLSMRTPDGEILPQASGFDSLCLNLLDATLKGFAVGEILWTADGNEIVASEIRAKDQRRFCFSPGRTGYVLNLKTWSNLLPGEPVPPRKFIVHSFGAKDGSPYGLGLGTRLFWPVFFKRQDITFWLAFVDKFASPTVVGKYPSGTEASEKAVLMAAMAALRSESGIACPESMTIELLEAARSSSIDSYEKLARYMDEQISECVLGETGSTNQHGSGGSRARDEVGNEVRLELCRADGDLLSATLNSTVVKWITQLNLPGANPPTVWREFAEPTDLKALADRDGTLTSQCGVYFSPAYFERAYGFEPGDIERVGQPAPGEKRAGDSANPAEGLAYAEASSPVDAADLLAAKLGQEGMAATAPWFAELKKLSEEAPSLETLRDRVIDLYPALHPADLGTVIARASALAVLAGRAEVKDAERGQI